MRALVIDVDERLLIEVIEAVKRWRFEPATLEGKPVPVQINIEVSFRLF